ncbi:MAG TPA: IPTL-CTERM sorting domain-containing protein, partial [Thermoanaerobaculia bacterium]|nr:IPTL-CTERM sorting domain-containing protein [Thermoanaerobaculia bacterium]
SYNVLSVQSADFTVNPGFNGGADTNLLAAGNTLAVGASGTITLTLRVDSGGQRGPYTNQVTGQGTSPNGTPVTDVSQDGDDTDPDDDGDGTDNNEPTVFILVTDVIEVPTLDVWGLLLLTGLLAAFALHRLRRRA